MELLDVLGFWCIYRAFYTHAQPLSVYARPLFDGGPLLLQKILYMKRATTNSIWQVR